MAAGIAPTLARHCRAHPWPRWLEKEGVPVNRPGLEGLGVGAPSEQLRPLVDSVKVPAPPAHTPGAVPTPSPMPAMA